MCTGMNFTLFLVPCTLHGRHAEMTLELEMLAGIFAIPF